MTDETICIADEPTRRELGGVVRVLDRRTVNMRRKLDKLEEAICPKVATRLAKLEKSAFLDNEIIANIMNRLEHLELRDSEPEPEQIHPDEIADIIIKAREARLDLDLTDDFGETLAAWAEWVRDPTLLITPGPRAWKPSKLVNAELEEPGITDVQYDTVLALVARNLAKRKMGKFGDVPPFYAMHPAAQDYWNNEAREVLDLVTGAIEEVTNFVAFAAEKPKGPAVP